MKMVSLDNGRTFISARELEPILTDRPNLFPVLVHAMDKHTLKAVNALKPASPADFLWIYLSLAEKDIIVKDIIIV